MLHHLTASYVCEEVPWPRPFDALQCVDLGKSKPASDVEEYDVQIRMAVQAPCKSQSGRRVFRWMLPARMIDVIAADGQWMV